MSRAHKSLTLIELVVAVAVLAIVVSGEFLIFQQGLSLAKKSREKNYSSNLAIGVLEEYSDWNRLSGFSDGSENDLDDVSLHQGKGDMIYHRKIVVYNDNGVTGIGNDSLKKIEVRVWPDNRDEAHAVSIVTYVGKNL